MVIARTKGKQPKLSDKQQKEVARMYTTGDYSISDLPELFFRLETNCLQNSSAHRSKRLNLLLRATARAFYAIPFFENERLDLSAEALLVYIFHATREALYVSGVERFKLKCGFPRDLNLWS